MNGPNSKELNDEGLIYKNILENSHAWIRKFTYFWGTSINIENNATYELIRTNITFLETSIFQFHKKKKNVKQFQFSSLIF